ncbi:MAG: rhodanese-like domain-containing protein [Candidatus Cloacimonetes bacterium]|nr:rhodanese-like domain-containing protein [Candidatus Cloacimonadota bacterium]
MIIKVILLLVISTTLTARLNSQEITYARLDVEEFQNRILELEQSELEFVILDVRTVDEFNAGHLEGASQIDFYAPNFADLLNELPKDVEYLIYCRTGRRTGVTLQLMQKLGFKNISDLKNGIKSWIDSGLPVVKD